MNLVSRARSYLGISYFARVKNVPGFIYWPCVLLRKLTFSSARADTAGTGDLTTFWVENCILLSKDNILNLKRARILLFLKTYDASHSSTVIVIV